MYTTKNHTEVNNVNKYNLKKNLKILNQDDFKRDLQLDWQETFKLKQENPGICLGVLLNVMNALIGKHSSLIKMTNNEAKLQIKPLFL